MVIANLDNQVEKVFGLSTAQTRREPTNHTDDSQIAAAEPATESTSSSETDGGSRASLHQGLQARMPDESLDETELPVWLL
jgi:hypothetical protein